MFEFNQKTGEFNFNQIDKVPINKQTRKTFIRDLQEKHENDQILKQLQILKETKPIDI